MSRRGKYQQVSELILEYLVTSTDSGRCPRNILVKRLGIPESTASDVLKSMGQKGLIKTGKRSFDNVQSIELREKGWDAFNARYEKYPYEIPVPVKRYLSNRGIEPDDFFTIQKDFIERRLLKSRRNVSVFGYPGAGKTLVAEMAICDEVLNGGKALYCTPYKALDWQKFTDFTNSFKIFDGIKILVADGDSPVSNEALEKADIVIGTFERVMGAIRSKEEWLSGVTLVCVDELTTLADEDRGGTLDTILTFLLRQDPKRRVLTMSSLVENTLEISRWLDAELIIDNRPAFSLPIDECIIYSEDGKIAKWHRNGKKETADGERPLDTIIRNNLQSGLTTIVFAGMREGTRYIAESLAKLHSHDPRLDHEVKIFLEGLKEKSSQVDKLCRMIPHGIAYHHAGLQRKVRRFIEDLIRRDMLKTVVATTTLSHGVDYKIDSVVIDTSPVGILRNLRVFEYINLKGRTGRPGKSRSADVYLLCNARNSAETFTRYFSSAPESIRPEATLSDANLSALILSYSYPQIDLERVLDFARKTFCCLRKPVTISDLRKIARKLVEHGFLTESGGKFIVTELGLRTNKADLSVEDALLILASDRDPDSLLRTSTQIDILRRMKLNSELMNQSTAIIKAWTSGKTLDDIRKLTAEEFHDQDILDLVSYTSLSLRKMATFVEDDRIKEVITKFQEEISKRPTKM